MAGTPDVITIIVADDHPVVREGIAAMIAQQPDMRVVGEASDGPETLELWRKLRPRLVILDLEMPRMGGIDTFARIREECLETQAIVLSVFQSEEDIYRATEAGVSAYLVKDTPRLELLQTIRRVAAGERCMDARVAAKLADRIAKGALSAREIQVLSLVATGRANKEIAAELFISEGTVKAHLKSIFGKLDAVSRTEAVQIALQRGIIRLH
ncbi:MAG: response regulator transcription factor [Candidatus Sumerlaeia bacterium]|nr:response regulator transcription factor [Candidatus Sumerlaeia bacterium]